MHYQTVYEVLQELRDEIKNNHVSWYHSILSTKQMKNTASIYRPCYLEPRMQKVVRECGFKIADSKWLKCKHVQGELNQVGDGTEFKITGWLTKARSNNKHLLDEVFVISRIIKVEARVISQSQRLRLITLTKICSCFFTDRKQHNAHELDMITRDLECPWQDNY